VRVRKHRVCGKRAQNSTDSSLALIYINQKDLTSLVATIELKLFEEVGNNNDSECVGKESHHSFQTCLIINK
jgi:hypothetical protein